jgi:hypothetical protein
MSFASEAMRNQYKSDIFFTGGNTTAQPVSRPVRENLKANVFNTESMAAGTPSGVKHVRDHHRSDILNSSNTQEGFHRPTPSFNAKKTNIIFGDAEPVVVKKDKTKHVHNPDPYFKQETAFTRKIKEFYPGEYEKFKDLADSNKITHGTIENEDKKQSENRMKEFSNPSLTARERKIIANNSSVNPVEAKNLAQSLQNNKSGKEKVFNNHNAMENKVNEMKSNIFYDPTREQVYQNFKPSKKQKEEEEKKPEQRPAKIPKTNWKTNMDWIEAKNEILNYNEDSNKNSSAFERKIKNLQGNMQENNNKDNEKKFEPVPNPIENKRQDNNARHDINSTLKDAVGHDEHRLKKNVELSSVQQGSEFYKNNAKFMKNIDRPVKSYEIKDIPNFENLKVDEIESIFRKKG